MLIALWATIISLLALLIGSGLIIQSLVGKSVWQRRTRRVWARLPGIQPPLQMKVGLQFVYLSWIALCLSMPFVIPFWLDIVLSVTLTAFLLVGLITCELHLGRMVLTNPLDAPEPPHPWYLKVLFLRMWGIAFLFYPMMFLWVSEYANGLLGSDLNTFAAPSFLELLLVYMVIVLLYLLSAWLYRRWIRARRRQLSMLSQAIPARRAHIPSRRALLGLAGGAIVLSVGGGWWLWSYFQRWLALLPIEVRSLPHPLYPSTLAYWSRDLRYVAVESNDGRSFSLWDVEKQQVFSVLHTSGSDLIHEGGWSPDNRFFSIPLAEGQKDALLAIFETSSGKQLSLLGESSYSFGWSPNSQWVAVSDGTQLSIWEVSSGKLLQERQLPGASNQPIAYNGLAWSPDGKRIALAMSPGIEIWDITTNQLVKEIAFSNYSMTPASGELSWSPDGSHLTLRGQYQPLTVVNYTQPGNTFVIPGRASSSTQVFAWSPDGQYIAVGEDYTLEVWSVTQQMPVYKYAYPFWSHPITDVSWPSDGRSIVAVSWTERRTWSWW